MAQDDVHARMAAAWPGIEARILRDGEADPAGPLSDEYQLFLSLQQAFRVEVSDERTPDHDPVASYVLCFDADDERANKSFIEFSKRDGSVLRRYTDDPIVTSLSYEPNRPPEGIVCERYKERSVLAATLDDVPTFKPADSTVPLVQRDPYWLTPIEAPFYDALAETGLTFSVQPWIQHTDTKYSLPAGILVGGNSATGSDSQTAALVQSPRGGTFSGVVAWNLGQYQVVIRRWQTGDVPTVQRVEKQIKAFEGFNVKILHPDGRDARGDLSGLPGYSHYRRRTARTSNHRGLDRDEVKDALPGIRRRCLPREWHEGARQHDDPERPLYVPVGTRTVSVAGRHGEEKIALGSVSDMSRFWTIS